VTTSAATVSALSPLASPRRVTVESLESGAGVERRDDEWPAVRPASQPVRNTRGSEHERPFVGAPALERDAHGCPLEILHLGQ
jgi:hypothetical protein